MGQLLGRMLTFHSKAVFENKNTLERPISAVAGQNWELNTVKKQT